MIELVTFLGNPGREYSANRHNAGFMLAEELSFYNELDWQKKYKGLYAALERSRLRNDAPAELPGKLHFLKPLTFMNLVGQSVSQAAAFFKIKPESILTVHDELELPLGTISLKFGGGLGGHNGLRSMKADLGSAEFWRIRIGIGRPDHRLPGEGGPPGSGRGIVDWVLTNFSEAELQRLGPVLKTGADLLHRALTCDPKTLLKEWAKKKIELEEAEPDGI
ncbi:MAG: aminoacyl-tRNA hydrolase [Treponema sp.]|nr:aminoacyl-tRNA hydrolase [Treponema sp.]